MRCSTESRERGFTLIELLIAMTLALIVIASLASAFISQRKTYDVQEQITGMMQEARAAMDMISREVKMAGYDPTNAGIVGIPYSTTQLQIVADIDNDAGTGVGDGDTTDANESIIYTYDGTNLQIDRATGGGSPQPFAENIQAFTFAYYDSNGIATTTAADIRQIEITITAQTSKPDPNYGQNSGYRRYTLTSKATPPNLGL